LPSGLAIGDSTNPQILGGTVLPEGNITAPPGSIYLRNITGSGHKTFRKLSGTGNTNWQALNDSGEISATFNATDSVWEVPVFGNASIENNTLMCKGSIVRQLAGDQTISPRFIVGVFFGTGSQAYTLKLKASLSHNNAGVTDFIEKHYYIRQTVVATSGISFGLTPVFVSTKPGFTNGTLDFTVSNPTDRGLTQGAAPHWFQFDLALTSGRTSPVHNVLYELHAWRAS